jgi:hypothetical protein
VEKNHCGIEMQSQTPEDLANAILYIKNLPNDEYNAYCENAFKTAKEFDYGYLSERMFGVIKSVLK